MVDDKLDAEELELLESLENDEWHSVENLDDEIKKYTQYAKNTIKKDKRINIRISSKDLEMIKTNAIELGLPYQTLVSSILHQYVTGRLIQKVS
jgi:predicted DNA binding CopG/RHH family protein